MNSLSVNAIRRLKLDLMLKHFAEGEKLQRFQAEKLGDHCLHTKVSDLKRKHRIHFQRLRVQIWNRFGRKKRVMLYWPKGEDLVSACLACNGMVQS